MCVRIFVLALCAIGAAEERHNSFWTVTSRGDGSGRRADVSDPEFERSGEDADSSHAKSSSVVPSPQIPDRPFFNLPSGSIYRVQ